MSENENDRLYNEIKYLSKDLKMLYKIINANLKDLIKKEGFKLDFKKCIENKKIEDFILNDRIEGAKNFKVNSTPTIIINNEKFEKTLNYKNLKKSLEKMI